ncbi:metallophosphoesterase [Actinocatenispora rupis]|uniref:Serine/threonine protein phosphatase n=1 Tax=Actinocatenispora rupis TaxID=519421 RepID=A0A8J3JFA6_9ACTN|nr:serine/threonine protein phosphatase [Actinocatenispora rupis]
MKTKTAFVGDVHGNLTALNAMLRILAAQDLAHVVFLGDYINKGKESREVLQELISVARSGTVTLLRGNHETALLDALDTGNLGPFLKMGGAVTIRSYVGGRNVRADVLSDFRENLPREHVDAIRNMPETYETEDLIAKHVPPPVSGSKFRISAHLPIGELPVVREGSAQLDTGCDGTGGRLTALLWPTLDFVQVESSGDIVRP